MCQGRRVGGGVEKVQGGKENRCKKKDTSYINPSVRLSRSRDNKCTLRKRRKGERNFSDEKKRGELKKKSENTLIEETLKKEVDGTVVLVGGINIDFSMHWECSVFPLPSSL